MHGLGNDFVVVDTSDADRFHWTGAQVSAIADRRTGVGCDQFIVLQGTASDSFAGPGPDGDSIRMRIFNADGSEVEACGNAARCVGLLLGQRRGHPEITIDTAGGRIRTRLNGERVTVDMGPARLDWSEIPLACAHDTLALSLTVGPLAAPTAVSVGNPHAVFFVDDADAIDLATWGPQVEHHPLFPARTNVEVVQVLAPDRLRMRVWERGVGITRACGTGACAAAIASARRGLTGRSVEVALDGGPLDIVWHEDGHVDMSGPATRVFEGRFAPSFLDSLDHLQPRPVEAVR